MPLDPQARALLDASADFPPTEQLTPEEARAAHEEQARLHAGQPRPMAQTRDLRVPASDGDIPVRVYLPEAGAQLPGLVYFHGGGWVTGSLATADVVCRGLAEGGRCVVVSVEYRRAPEHKFPAGLDDAVAATRWVAAHAPDLGIDAARLAVGGDSAGGNLAAAVALVLRDSGGPPLAFQLLIYPVLDHNFGTRSYLDNGTGYGLTRSGMQYYWRHYLADAAQGADPRASPLRAADLGGLPPAHVITAEYDPLRDEADAYAERLRQTGVPVAYREYAGMTHGFVTNAGVLDQGQQVITEMGAALRAVLGAARGSVAV